MSIAAFDPTSGSSPISRFRAAALDLQQSSSATEQSLKSLQSGANQADTASLSGLSNEASQDTLAKDSSSIGRQLGGAVESAQRATAD